MSEIIKNYERETIVDYSHEFIWRDDPNGGFSFPTDKDGNLLPTNDCALENYRKCLDGTYDVINKGIVKNERSVMNPMQVRCNCGEIVYIDKRDTTCDNCGQWYNGFGQELLPPSMWGEDCDGYFEPYEEY